MRLTTARYYTPSGRSIQARGIDPDIVVEQAKLEKITQPERRREENLRGRLDNPGGGNGGGPGGVAEKKEAKGPDDYQLSRALDLLRGIALYGTRASN